jgi:hypothetical protein
MMRHWMPSPPRRREARDAARHRAYARALVRARASNDGSMKKMPARNR